MQPVNVQTNLLNNSDRVKVYRLALDY